MRVTLEVEGERFEVEVERREGRTRVRCEDESWDVETRSLARAVDLGPPMAQRVEFPAPGVARVGGAPVAYAVTGLEQDAQGEASAADGTAVRALMPGRLVRVLARPGQRIERGAPLFVLEAMKMQNELASPAGGVLVDVLVNEGDVVEAGRILARVSQS